MDSCTLPSLCKRICWVFVTTNTLGLPSITLDRHLTHSKTTAQACSSVIGALKSWVIFANDKQPSWVSWHGVQLVSLYFVFAAILYGFWAHQLLCIQRGKMLHTKHTLNWIFYQFFANNVVTNDPIPLPQNSKFKLSKVTSYWTHDMRCHRAPKERGRFQNKARLTFDSTWVEHTTERFGNSMVTYTIGILKLTWPLQNHFRK